MRAKINATLNASFEVAAVGRLFLFDMTHMLLLKVKGTLICAGAKTIKILYNICSSNSKVKKKLFQEYLNDAKNLQVNWHMH